MDIASRFCRLKGYDCPRVEGVLHFPTYELAHWKDRSLSVTLLMCGLSQHQLRIRRCSQMKIENPLLITHGAPETCPIKVINCLYHDVQA